MTGTVLFTASTWSHISNFHRPYLAAFRALGWTVHVACGGEKRDVPEANLCIPLSFEKKMSSPANLQAAKQLRRLVKEHHYALICTHTSLAAFFTRMAVLGLPHRPAVVNVAHGYLFDDHTAPLKRQILLTAERMTAPVTDLLLTMNHWDYDCARAHRLGRRVVNIPGVGVDFSRFAPLSADERAQHRTALGIGSDDFLLLYAAEFSTRKNQAMLLRALPHLPQRVKLALPGSGALLEECRQLAQALGVADRVLFPGHVDMPVWFAMADAAVSASRSEGLPFNVMEAMYAGLPVVATAVKGHTDLLQEGKTGLLYPYDDETAFLAAVRRLLEDPAAAAAMGAAARDHVLPYGIEPVLPQVMELYLSVLKTT